MYVQIVPCRWASNGDMPLDMPSLPFRSYYWTGLPIATGGDVGAALPSGPGSIVIAIF